MAKVKWLWSFAIAMGIVLLYASLSAYFVKIDGWYNSLRLPPAALSEKGMTIGWSVAYILNIIIIARLVYYKEHSKIIFPLALLGIINILWCMCFFTFKSPLAGFVFLLAACAITLLVFLTLMRRDVLSMIFFQPITAWYVYLAIVNYLVFALNK